MGGTPRLLPPSIALDIPSDGGHATIAVSGVISQDVMGRTFRGVRAFQSAHTDEATEALARLKEAAVNGDNVFAVLMDAARVCSLQQVTEAFFEVGGQYRRNI